MRTLLAIASALLVTSVIRAQTSLPPQVQADMLIGRIDAALAAGNAQEALAGIADYRKLGVKVPPALLFMEGRLAAIAKDYARSKKVLDEYFARPEARTDKSYADAISLYADVERAVERSKTAEMATALEKSKSQCAASTLASAKIVAAEKVGTVFRDCSLAPEMVIVPSGSFLMGASVDEKGSDDNERPVHRVAIRALAVGQYEVTFAEWDVCVNNGGCDGYRPAAEWGRGRHPVINVNWNDAQGYVSWLSSITSQKYRLLTEAEWEYVARAGVETPYNTGSYINNKQANFALDYNDRTVEVGKYEPNPFGLYDTHGNVTEIVQDCISSDYRSSPIDGSPNIISNCPMIVGRGGPPYNGALRLRSAHRWPLSKDERNNYTGFRIGREL